MQRGDLVFAHSKGVIGWAIRFGEHGSEWNHVAVLNEETADGWTIYQAESKGVTADKLLDSVAPGGNYIIVSLPEGRLIPWGTTSGAKP